MARLLAKGKSHHDLQVEPNDIGHCVERPFLSESALHLPQLDKLERQYCHEAVHEIRYHGASGVISGVL